MPPLFHGGADASHIGIRLADRASQPGLLTLQGEKSRYVELLRGKDPPIQVTEIGLAFIGVVRRIFPAYGDPVGRADVRGGACGNRPGGNS